MTILNSPSIDLINPNICILFNQKHVDLRTPSSHKNNYNKFVASIDTAKNMIYISKRYQLS